MTSSTPKAVVLDIDGVLWRDGKMIPGADRAVSTLRSHNIPTLFITNGGGTPNKYKASQMGECLGIEVRRTPNLSILRGSRLNKLKRSKQAKLRCTQCKQET